MVDMLIPTREDLLLRVGRVCPGRPWLESKSVRDVQVFIRLLSTFHPKMEDHRATHLDAQDEHINGLIS